jgi:hypothetical protein
MSTTPGSGTPTASPESFKAQLAALTAQLAGRPLDAELDDWLNREHGAASATYAITGDAESFGLKLSEAALAAAIKAGCGR